MTSEDTAIIRSVLGRIWAETIRTPAEFHSLLTSVSSALRDENSKIYFQGIKRLRDLQSTNADFQEVRQAANGLGVQLNQLLMAEGKK